MDFEKFSLLDSIHSEFWLLSIHWPSSLLQQEVFDGILLFSHMIQGINISNKAGSRKVETHTQQAS